MAKGILLRAFLVLITTSVIAQAQSPTVLFGTKHAVALRNNGEVLTWGENLFCQLGRPSAGNSATVPTVVMRNVKEIAAATTHTFAVTADGKVYSWGGNARGALGLGHEYEQCEGPALVDSLADKSITHISTGYSFAVAVSSTGDLYCAGENDMLQCPAAKDGRTTVFLRVPFPELAGKVASVSAGMFHVLVQTTDGKMYAFGRGRDGQLGNGRTTNGFSAIPELTDVVSFSAGTWHSAAVKSDGSVWLWGNDSKSQLCDGATVNRAVPARVTLPGQVKATGVVAGGHSTIIRTSDGALYACGDNQAGLLGINAQPVVPRPALIPVPAPRTTLVSMGGGNAAASPDGCAVLLSGLNEGGIVGVGSVGQPVAVFSSRQNLTLCGAKATTPQPTLVFDYPKGGQSGCWTPRVEEDDIKNLKWLPLRQGMLAAEDLLRRNAALLAPLQPSRFRTTIGAGPYNESGAQMHVKVVPERKTDLTRLWTGACDVIPQVDRIGGEIAQVSVFFNTDVRSQFISPTGEAPKLTGRVAGYPEYNHWVVITKDNRLPWIPQTLADKLDAIAAQRAKKLADWKRDTANDRLPDPAASQSRYETLKKTDPAGAENFLNTMKAVSEEFARRLSTVIPAQTAQLEKQIDDLKKYRGSFTPQQLSSAAVSGDPSGEEKRRMEARVAALRALTAGEQQQLDAWSMESRALERQAQAATATRSTTEAASIRAQASDLANKVRALRNQHMERVTPEINDQIAQYELASLKPGPAEQAISVKPDPALPNFAEPNRIQLITILFSETPDPKAVELAAWQQRVKQTFDFAGLAALLK